MVASLRHRRMVEEFIRKERSFVMADQLPESSFARI
jgi:hypothetical protein